MQKINVNALIVMAFILIMFMWAGTWNPGAGKTPTRANSISTEQSINAIHFTGNVLFTGGVVKTDGTNAATITIYNGQDNSGTKIMPASFQVAGSALVWPFDITPGIPCPGGIYVEISGTGASIMIMADQG